MKKLFFLVFVAFLAVTVSFGQTVGAQKKTIVKEVKSAKVEKTRGENPNIKSGVPTADVPVAKQRGDCAINFDNYTGYMVNVYVDGNYKGTVDAWGNGWVVVGNGYTTVYVITVGGTYEWSSTGECSDEAITFKLAI
jgi:hypothetical protein